MVVALLGTGYVAGRNVFAVAEPSIGELAPATYLVREQTVGRSITMGAEAGWEAVGVLRVRRAGIVTSLSDDLASIEEGSVVATIDLVPVVVGQGEIPAFRDLAWGAVGDDVAQLQHFLNRLEYLDIDVDGRFGGATHSAVQAWQQTSGFRVDGIVSLGDIIWVPNLPAPLRPVDGVGVDVDVSSGEVLLEHLAESPRVWLRTSRDQLNLLPRDADVVVKHGGHSWTGRLGQAVTVDEGVEYALVDDAGGPVCSAECAEIPVTGTTQVAADIILVEEVTGPAVPRAAILTEADGSTFVGLSTGRRLPVTVRAMVDGIAVVDGVDVGNRILLSE